jgi:hypothetical protein
MQYLEAEVRDGTNTRGLEKSGKGCSYRYYMKLSVPNGDAIETETIRRLESALHKPQNSLGTWTYCVPGTVRTENVITLGFQTYQEVLNTVTALYPSPSLTYDSAEAADKKRVLSGNGRMKALGDAKLISLKYKETIDAGLPLKATALDDSKNGHHGYTLKLSAKKANEVISEELTRRIEEIMGVNCGSLTPFNFSNPNKGDENTVALLFQSEAQFKEKLSLLQKNGIIGFASKISTERAVDALTKSFEISSQPDTSSRGF